MSIGDYEFTVNRRYKNGCSVALFGRMWEVTPTQMWDTMQATSGLCGLPLIYNETSHWTHPS